MIKSAKDRNEEIFEHDPNKILEDKLKKFGNNWKKSKFNNIDRIIMASLLIGLIGIGINMPQIQAEYRNQKYPFMCGNASRLPDIKDNDIIFCRINCAERYGCYSGWGGNITYNETWDYCVCSDGAIRYMSDKFTYNEVYGKPRLPPEMIVHAGLNGTVSSDDYN